MTKSISFYYSVYPPSIDIIYLLNNELLGGYLFFQTLYDKCTEIPSNDWPSIVGNVGIIERILRM